MQGNAHRSRGGSGSEHHPSQKALREKTAFSIKTIPVLKQSLGRNELEEIFHNKTAFNISERTQAWDGPYEYQNS